MITPTDAAWLAGYVDGEGTFQIVEKRRSKAGVGYVDAQLAVTSTDRRTLDRCAEISGAGTVWGPFGTRSNRGKPAYRWTVRGKQLSAVIDAIRPWLISKAEQADVVALFRSTVRVGASPGSWGVGFMSDADRADRIDMKLAINALNHRGSLPVPPERLEALARVQARIATVEQAS